jgi:hypothetical protein
MISTTTQFNNFPKYSSLHLLLLLWLYSPLLGLDRFFSFLILCTVGRTPWMGDQPVTRPLPAHRTTQTQNKRTRYRHTCLEWVSNSRSQRSSERRQFMPWPLWSVRLDLYYRNNPTCTHTHAHTQKLQCYGFQWLALNHFLRRTDKITRWIICGSVKRHWTPEIGLLIKN